MTDDEALQQAVDAAEAEVAGLEAQLAAVAEGRRALSREALAALWTRHDELTRSLLGLTVEEHTLRTEQAQLEEQLARPRFRVPTVVASPLTWFLNTTAFVIYAGSLVMSHRFLHSPGLMLALLFGLPVAFVLLMVAGSLRESGAAESAGAGTGHGEEPARLAAVDERIAAPPGGPGGDGAAEGGVEPPRDADRSGP